MSWVVAIVRRPDGHNYRLVSHEVHVTILSDGTSKLAGQLTVGDVIGVNCRLEVLSVETAEKL